MCLKIRCDGESKNFAKIFWEVNKTRVIPDLPVPSRTSRQAAGTANSPKGQRGAKASGALALPPPRGRAPVCYPKKKNACAVAHAAASHARPHVGAGSRRQHRTGAAAPSCYLGTPIETLPLVAPLCRLLLCSTHHRRPHHVTSKHQSTRGRIHTSRYRTTPKKKKSEAHSSREAHGRREEKALTPRFRRTHYSPDWITPLPCSSVFRGPGKARRRREGQSPPAVRGAEHQGRSKRESKWAKWYCCGILRNTLSIPIPIHQSSSQQQSFVMAFFPSIATAKLELNSLYRKYVDMFGISLNNSTVGCHLTRKMAHLPVLLIDRTFFSTGSAIQSIATSYGALIRRWLLNRTSVVQHTLISSAMNSLSWCGSLPFFVSIGVLITKLCDCTMTPNHFCGRQCILSHSANLRGESVLVMDNNELGNDQSFLSSFLGRKRDYVVLALQCICYPAYLKVVDVPHKKLSFSRQWMRTGHDTSAIWRIMARNEQYLACMIVLATLQLFLRLTRVNVTILFLPMLSRAISSRTSPAVIGNIVLVLVNSCGVLGSALSVKQFGREVTFAISAIVMVICQVAIPLILEVQIGVGGGTRMPMGYTTAMFALTCVVSCGLSWSWGSFFWTFPGRKVHSAGQVLAMAVNLGVCFAQMQYFLLVLCRLKNATLAYYALWIWS